MKKVALSLLVLGFTAASFAATNADGEKKNCKKKCKSECKKPCPTVKKDCTKPCAKSVQI